MSDDFSFNISHSYLSSGLSADCRIGCSSDRSAKKSTPDKAVPVTPFRVLDAPHLKDDYYCTVLAYSHSHRTLAVAL